MARKRYTAEDIITTLGEAEVELAKGLPQGKRFAVEEAESGNPPDFVFPRLLFGENLMLIAKKV